MLRRLLIVLLILILLVAAGAVAAHLVLRSDLPRQIAIDQIEQVTGLRAEIDAFELSWRGRASVTNLRLATPLEDEPFIEVESADARFRPLLLTAVTRNPAIKHVAVDGVQVALRQHPDGQWNALEAMDRIDREPPDRRRRPPRVEVSGGVVTVDDAEGRHARLHGITLSGEPAGGFTFAFDATAEPGLAANGRVNLRGAYRHRGSFAIDGVRDLLHDWIAELDLPEGDLVASGEWTGRVIDGEVQGRLAVDQLFAGPISGEGVLNIRAGETGLNVGVERWLAAVEHQPVGPVRLSEGDLRLAGGQLRVQGLQLHAMQTDVGLDGAWSLADQHGNASLTWSGHMPERMNLTHHGEAELAFEPITPAQQQITATIDSRGGIDAGTWNGRAVIEGSGPSVQQMTWNFRLPRGEWTDPERRIDLADTAAELAMDLPNLTLREMRLAGEPVSGSATADLEQRQWRAELAMQQWEVPLADLPAPVDFTLRGYGDVAAAHIENFSLQTEDVAVDVTDGRYMFLADRPLDAGFRAVLLHEVDPAIPSDDPAVALPPGAAVPPEPLEPRFAGRLAVEGEVRGSLVPFGLELTGDAHADQLVLNHYRLHDIATPFEAGLAERRLTVRTPESFDLLGGRARAAVRYTLAGEVGEGREEAEASVQINDLALGRAAFYADPDLEVTGTLGASLDVSIPDRDLARLRALGEWEVHDLHLHELVRLDHAEGGLSTRRSLLHLEPIVLRQGEGVAAGRAEYDLLDARTVQAELTVTDWPVDLETYQLATRINGEVSLDMDVIEPHVAGQVDVGAYVDWRDHHLGQFFVSGGLTGRTLSLRHIEGNVLDGLVEGEALLRLDDLYASEGRLRWEEIDLAAAQPWLNWQESDQLTGRIAGRVDIGAATVPRAPEPMQIELSFVPDDEASFRETPLGRSVATVFAGPERLVLSESTFALADGSLGLWVQAVPRDGRWFAHTRANFERLDIDALNRSLDPDAAQVAGRLGGRISAFGFIDDPGSLAGQGLLRLNHSDLADTHIIGALYDTMALQFRDPEPTGVGRVRLRVDSGSLRIDEFQYFNRGVDMYGHGTVADLALGAESPVEGTLVGTLRPLRGVNLPLAADIDRLLRSLQTVAGSIRVTGTVREPRTRPAAIADVQAVIERLLGPQEVD